MCILEVAMENKLYRFVIAGLITAATAKYFQDFLGFSAAYRHFGSNVSKVIIDSTLPRVFCSYRAEVAFSGKVIQQ